MTFNFNNGEFGSDFGNSFGNGYNGYDGPVITEAVTAMLVFLGIILFIAIAIAIVFYVFSSLALMRIAKNRNIENPWLAWIPVGRDFLIGKLGDYYEMRQSGTNSKLAIWILALILGGMGACFTIIFSFLGVFAIAAAEILEYICLYRFYKSVNPSGGTAMFVLSILFSVAAPFILFSQRNKPDMAPAPFNAYQQTPPQNYPPQYTQPAYDPSRYAQPQYTQPQNTQARYNQSSFDATDNREETPANPENTTDTNE